MYYLAENLKKCDYSCNHEITHRGLCPRPRKNWKGLFHKKLEDEDRRSQYLY